MRITMDSQGGFAGIAFHWRVDTADLSPEEAAAVTDLVARAGVFTRDDAPPLQRRGFDMQRYRLVVEDGERRRTLHFDDASIPAETAPLLTWLRRQRPDTADS